MLCNCTVDFSCAEKSVGSVWFVRAIRDSPIKPMAHTNRVSSRIFCLGGKIVCKDQLCVKHAKFLSPFLSINHQCTKKHKARVFIIIFIIVN